MISSYDFSFLAPTIPNIETFLNEGGEAFIHGLTHDEVSQLEDYCLNYYIKIKMSWINNVLYIKRPLPPQVAPSGIFNYALGDLNKAISSISSEPVDQTGSSRQRIEGGMYYFEADASAQVDRIVHNSANVVLETTFRNRNGNYTDFFAYLRSYLLDTNDVMAVLGYFIFDPQEVSEMSMVGVVYDRNHFFNPHTLHQPTRLISFGNSILPDNLRNHIEHAAAGANGVAFPMTGVGLVTAPLNVLTLANADNPLYTIDIEASYFLRQDNNGNDLIAPVPVDALGNDIPFIMRLWDVQKAVLRSFARM